MQIQRLIYGVFALLIGAGCQHRPPDISRKISDEEYSVYSAWIRHHFKQQPARLLIQNLTFIFDPIGTLDCRAALEKQGHVDRAMLQALHRLGEAKYLVHTEKFRTAPFKIPWQFEESDGPFSDPPRPFRMISFSRIAFNADRSMALFAVSDSCGGLCGGGGALLATRKNGAWNVNADLGCIWIY